MVCLFNGFDLLAIALLTNLHYKHRIIAIVLISNNIMAGERNASGMLAVFMQPDSSLDEDVYAQTLNVVKT